MYNIYPDSEICVVVLFRTDLDSWLPDGLSTLFFRSKTISLANFKGKIHMDSIMEQTVIPLVFEVRLSRNDPDASPKARRKSV